MSPETKKAVDAARAALALAQGYKAAHDRVAATLPASDLVKAAADEIVAFGLVPADRKDEVVAALSDPVNAVQTCRNLAKVAHDLDAQLRDRRLPAEVAGEPLPAKKTAAGGDDAEEVFYRDMHDEMAKLAAVAGTPLV